MSKSNKTFAIIGAAGYIAPRHMSAIKANNGALIAALDPNDSVGILDQYFPDSQFFTSFERFERFVVKQKNSKPIDYFSICSPNHHHDTHCRFALINGSDAICEKPLVINPWNLDVLKQSEKETGHFIYNILQLRLHPEIIKLKNYVAQNHEKVFDIDLTYITARGPWYNISWKGDLEKSGGITSNIGVHFFDMLIWIFGGVHKQIVHVNESTHAGGFLQLKKANIRWFLSVDANHLPEDIRQGGKKTLRSLTINKEAIDFTSGFEDLHIKSYEAILNGHGFTTSDVQEVIELGHTIRNAKPVGKTSDYHPILNSI